jgi:hypothetical protein
VFVVPIVLLCGMCELGRERSLLIVKGNKEGGNEIGSKAFVEERERDDEYLQNILEFVG